MTTFRLLPRLTPENEHFWQGGAEGKLQFLRCQACRYWIHPPSPRCPECLSTELGIEAATGLGVVHTFTVNHQPWYPGFDPPYVIAIIELDDQLGLRLTTNLVDCEVEAVTVGMPVQVKFEPYDDVWLPLFAPRD